MSRYLFTDLCTSQGQAKSYSTSYEHFGNAETDKTVWRKDAEGQHQRHRKKRSRRRFAYPYPWRYHSDYETTDEKTDEVERSLYQEP